MRNPLNAIIQSCYLLENKKETNKDELDSRLKIMRVSSNLLISFVNDLMDWT
jgi:signal transduction histidine kinase